MQKNAVSFSTVAMLLAGALVVALTGCSHGDALQSADIRPLHYSTGASTLERVDGIRRALAASPQAPVRVLAVHGMITHEAGFSEELQERIADRLGLAKGAASGQTELVRGYDFVPAYGPQPFDGVSKLPATQLRRTVWTSKTANGTAVERLVFYEMLWAPLRDQVKDTFVGCFERGEVGSKAGCRPFSASKPNTDARFSVNKALKESITLGGFADATLVLGPIGDVIRDDLTLAMCVVAADFLQPGGDALASAAKQRCNLAAAARSFKSQGDAAALLTQGRFFAVTHSLGSFLFLDAQHAFVAAQGAGEASAGLKGGGCSPANALCDEQVQAQLLFAMTDQATVFMNANQVSLLSLSRLSSAGCRARDGGPCPNPYLRSRSGANEPWNQTYGMPRMTVFVALNDANDLLGFELPPFLADTDGNRYVNVSVRNPGWQFPGLVKSPSAVHTHQARNPAVIDVIVEGFEVPK